MVGFPSEFGAKGWFTLRMAIAIFCGMHCLFLTRTAEAVTPAIYGQPVSQAALQGSNATFVVRADSQPLAYQWRFNGSDIAGVTNSALTLTNVQPANTGAYSVVVSNSSGAITSPPASLSLATPPDFLWARQVTNGLPPSYAATSAGKHVAADSSGNVFVAGTFSGLSPASVDFGGVGLTNAPGTFTPAAFICRYDRFGNVAWARLVTTNGGQPFRLAADSTGNVYFAGRFNGSATLGTNTLIGSGSVDLFLARYDSQGNALWARQIVGYDPSWFQVLALAVDENANVIISSRYTNAASISGTLVTNSSSFLAKFDNSGNLVWARPCGAAEAITVGASGSIYLTGSALPSTAMPGLLAKYDSMGNPVWSRQFPHGQCIAVDVSENIYATGSGAGTYGDITVTNVNGVPDFFISKCDNVGQLRWLRQVGSTNQPFGAGVALDAFGNIYVAAGMATARREALLKFGAVALTNTYSFLVKYDPVGNALWAVAPGGTNFAMPFGMALVDHREIYLAGQFKASASFGQFNLLDSNPTGSGAFYVAKFAADTSAAVTLGAPQLVAGGVQFSVVGVMGYKYAVEGSSDLIHWTPISTNTSPFVFSEVLSLGDPQRFYRSVYRP